MAVMVDSDLEVRIPAFNELLETLRCCAGRGCHFSIDDIQQALQAVAGGDEDNGPLLTLLLAIAIQQLVFI
jgi:hypothetical protein